MNTNNRFMVVAGANPADKGIFDLHFGHYGIVFARVSLAHEYSHDMERGAAYAAEYATRVVDALNENERLLSENKRLLSLMRRVEPHLDAIVCYASTCDEHEPNALARDIREVVGHTEAA